MTNQQPWYYSWPIIIIAFIFFWPLGLILLVLRQKNKKSNFFIGSTDKKKYYIIGAILVFIGISSFGESFLAALFFIAGGVALFYYAEKMAKRAVRNRNYIDFIINQGETSIDKIANMCNVQYPIVVKEVNQLINMGVLKDAIVNEATRSVNMMKKDPTISVMNEVMNGFEQGMQVGEGTYTSNEMVTVTCSGCGAKVSIKRGTSINCEYCDMPISAQ